MWDILYENFSVNDLEMLNEVNNWSLILGKSECGILSQSLSSRKSVPFLNFLKSVCEILKFKIGTNSFDFSWYNHNYFKLSI